MRFRPLASLLLLAALLSAGPASPGSAGASPSRTVVGESLVLAGAEPGRLAWGPARPGSVRVRSSYEPGLPNTVAYVEGRDYTVDPQAGLIRRTAESRIPDYTRNSLYGKKPFDHRQFPGFGNLRDFVYVDYESLSPPAWPVQPAQARLLPRTWTLLRSGGNVTVCAHGDSITAGGDASRQGLIYWERWLAALRRKYPKATIRGINSATGGDATPQGIARLEQKVLSHQPDLVLLAFGMNDQNVGSTPLDRFSDNLRRMIDEIRLRTGAEIVLVSSFPPNPNWAFTSGRMPEYARATAAVAAERKCAYANVFDNWNAVADRKKPEDMLANNVNHPNDFGHGLYAQVLEAMGL